MQIFQVMNNGEVHEILKEDSPIKDLLTPEESYILCDDDERIVYLWKGNQSKVRSKFIGARKMQDIRSQVGLNYRSISIDQDDATPDEFPEFFAAIENPRKNGFAQEIKEDGEELKFEIEKGPSEIKNRTYSSLMNSKFNQNIEQTGPLYKGGDTGVSPISDPYQTAAPKQMSQVELEKIIEELNKSEVPDGYTREMIIVGDKTYSETEKVQNFLGKKQIKRELELIDDLPEGVFLAEGYTPRLLVQDQIVLAIEFLKKIE